MPVPPPRRRPTGPGMLPSDAPDMKFPFSYFNFLGPRTAPEASSAGGQAGSGGAMPGSAARHALATRPGPRLNGDPGLPPALRRAVLGNEAGPSRLESLQSELIHKIALTGGLTARDAASMSATSKAMKAASAAALADLSAPGLAQRFRAVRTLADFKESLSVLKNSGLARARHGQLLTSLDTVMQRLPEPQRHAAIEEFVKSVDEFTGPAAGPGHNLAGGGARLMELRHAAQQGPSELQRFVTETHGRPAMVAGENAQDVASRLGVDPTRLEQMSAWRGSRNMPAGAAYRAVTESREDFNRILQRFGIVNPDVIDKLDAVHKSPEAAVTRGDNVQEVIARFNIRDRNAAFRLAEASVRGPAGQAVRDGMSPEDAERRYGLESSPFMLMQLRRVAAARDARAAEGRSSVEGVLRGAGRLLLGAARHVLASTLDDVARRTNRAAVRSLAGSAGTPAHAVLAATVTAAHDRLGPGPMGRRSGAADDGRLDRMLDAAERDVARLPMRPGWQRPE